MHLSEDSCWLVAIECKEYVQDLDLSVQPRDMHIIPVQEAPVNEEQAEIYVVELLCERDLCRGKECTLASHSEVKIHLSLHIPNSTVL